RSRRLGRRVRGRRIGHGRRGSGGRGWGRCVRLSRWFRGRRRRRGSSLSLSNSYRNKTQTHSNGNHTNSFFKHIAPPDGDLIPIHSRSDNEYFTAIFAAASNKLSDIIAPPAPTE